MIQKAAGPLCSARNWLGRQAPSWTLAVGALLAATLASGCASVSGSAGGVAGLLARLQPLTKTCRGPVNGYFAWDLSGTGRGGVSFVAQRLQELQGMADRVAACTGYIKVVAFSASETDTMTLGQQAFPAGSGTINARLIQANKLEYQLIAAVRSNLRPAAQQVSANGTDVLPELILAEQYQEQRGSGKLDVEVATDGIATTGAVIMNTRAFTDKVARAAAQRVPVPDLAGAQVRFVGIGHVAEPGSAQPPTWYATALTDFYTGACDRTHAKCLATTDYTQGS